MLVSFSKANEWSSNEADGLIHLYSISLQGRPELVLTCQYEVTKAIFNPHEPNIIIGATQIGYLLLWDVREKKEVSVVSDRRNRSQPIQKSCLAANGHNYPIFALSVVGSQAMNNIVSISNDGKMCVWKPKILQDPKDHFTLDINQQPRAGPGISTIGKTPAQITAEAQSGHVNVHCIDFVEGESEKFFVGSEDFNIYQCTIPKENTNPVHNCFYGHNAPVTSVHVHPGVSQNDRYAEMTELVLSASMDWTVILWNSKKKPLFIFESSQEYVYDVQWSPTHPSVFATCDAEGYVDVWNINRDKEMPVERKQVSNKPINCLRWSKDGRRIAVGDAQGFVAMLQVDADLAAPEPEDFEKIVALVQASGK